MTDSTKNTWDFQRFWQTLDYFDTIPFLGCWRKLIGQFQDKKMNGGDDRGMETILVIGATGTLGQTVIGQLEGQNYQIRALVEDIASARQLLGETVDLFSLPSPQLLIGVDRILYCADRDSLDDTLAWLKNAEIPAEKMLFDFTRPTADIQEIWGAIDDVVMGGVSESNLRLVRGRALFSGNVSTNNNGGFASVRTRNFTPPLDLSEYEGIALRVEGDGKRYKLIVRCENRWDGIGYCYSFDTLNRIPQTLLVPFAELIPVARAKTVRDAKPFDARQVYALQLMQSKFEYDGALNPYFSQGLFGLEIEWIKAYGGDRVSPPRLVVVNEEDARGDSPLSDILREKAIGN